MRYKFIHREARYPRPENHYDTRYCPDCMVLIPGTWADQRAHQEKDDRDRELLAELAKRCGMTEEQVHGRWSWGAEITGVEGDNDALEEAE